MNRLKHHYDSAPITSNRTGIMKGFDPEFLDIVDYILRITYRIWEGKQIGLCYDYYSANCPVYTLAGYVEGAEQVVQNTLTTLAAFPDRTLNAENIIWGGDDESGYHTSHLIDTKMTNLGDSDLGPATGKKARFKVIAHCVVKNNKIIEEWLVRDNYSLVEQLDFDIQDTVKKTASSTADEKFTLWRDSEINRVANADLNKRIELPINANSEQFILTYLQNIWNARMMGDAFDAYSDTAVLDCSASDELVGPEQIIRLFYGSILGSFSQLKVSFDYSCKRPNKTSGDDVAVRWTMTGLHTGRGAYGEPTGAPVLIIGESHYHIDKCKIQSECTVFDKLAILIQIERARIHANQENEE